MNPGRRVTGWVRFRIVGAEPERVLDALGKRGIPFWDAEPPADCELRVTVPWGKRKRIVPLAASLGCEAVCEASGGVPLMLGSVRRRISLLLALLLVLGLWCGSLSRIWDIRVEGNETVPEGLILQTLADVGVTVGSRWLGMRQDTVRNAVLLRLPELRWMTVTMEGCRARVIVREKREHPDPAGEDVCAKVVADRACFVTDVVAKRGTAADVVNRAVLPGETLIEGWATGKWGVQGPVRAIGYAKARTWYELTAAAPLELCEKEYTGEERRTTALLLGKKRINFYKGSSICPAGCDKIIYRYTLGRKGSFTLPLGMEVTAFRTCGIRSEEARELREELEAWLVASLEARVKDGVMTESAFTASEKDGVLYVTLRAACEERVGKTVPLTDGEIQQIQSKIPKTEDIT